MFKGLYLDGTGSASTDNPNVTSDLTVIVEFWKEIWPVAETQDLVSVYNSQGNQRSWIFRLLSGGLADFLWSTDGTAIDNTPGYSIAAILGFRAIKVEFDSDPGTVTISIADSKAGPWTQIGQHNIGSITTLFSSSADLLIGGHITGGGLTDPLQNSVIKAVEVYGGISTNLLVDARFDDLSRGTTSFTDNTSNVWTLSSDAIIVDGQTPEIGLWLPDSIEEVAEWAVVDTPGDLSEVNNNLIDAFVGDQTLNEQDAVITNNQGGGPFDADSSQKVKWREINGIAFVWWDIFFGANHDIPALGRIEIDLPVAADTSFHNVDLSLGVGDLIGEGHLYDSSSAGGRQLCSVQLMSGSKIRIDLEGGNPIRHLTGDDPFIPASSDTWVFNGVYKVAP